MNKTRIAFLVFIISGLIFLIGGALLCTKVFDYSGTAETTAVITDFESYRERSVGKWKTHYKTHLTYEVNGKSYTNVVKMYSSSWDIGEEIKIYYDINNPQNIGTKQTDLVLLVLPCLGLLFFSIGVIPIVISHKKKKAEAGNLRDE